MYDDSYLVKTLKWIRNKFCCCCDDDELKSKYVFERAPEPTDVYWENLNVSYWNRVGRVIMTYIATVLLIGICFAIIYGINVAKERAHDLEGVDSGLLRGLSILCSIIITIVNNALRTVVRQLSIKEQHETYTAYNLSVAFKLTLARFVNTSIVPIIVNVATNRWFVDGGLVSDFFYIMLSISFLDPILYYFDTSHYLRLLKRCVEKKKGEHSLMT